jgi:hypothetical protein
VTKSNTLTFTVTTAPPPPPTVEVTGNSISAPKTELLVDEVVTVTGSLTFSAALPSAKTVRIDVYSNNVKIDSFTVSAPSGSTSAGYSFNIKFSSAGTYEVYTDAYFV